MSKLYDRQGNEITKAQYKKLDDDMSYVILKTDIINGIEITTIWLGENKNWRRKEKPIIFQTAVFFRNSYEINYCERYSTEEEAFTGHQATVDRVNEMEKIRLSNISKENK